MKKRLALVYLALIYALAGCGEGVERPDLGPAVEGFFCTSPGSSRCPEVGVMLYCRTHGAVAFWERVAPAPSCKTADAR